MKTRIPRRDIVDMQPGTVSLMPQGLTDQLTQQELADLLAFLKATRLGRADLPLKPPVFRLKPEATRSHRVSFRL